MKTWILGILLLVVGLILAIGLWLLGYHLTGKWAFNRWKAERIAMGDRLDWQALAPPPVAPEQNFAEAPLVRGAIVHKGQTGGRFSALALPKGSEGALGNWMEGRRDNLDALGKACGTHDLETVFRPMESIFRELDQATRRSGNRFPIAYEEGEIPALLGFRGALRALRVRAVSNLHTDHTDLAMQDLQTGLRLADHLRSEPHLISALLRAALLNITLQVAWEGLEDHLWTAPQLTTLQAELARIDLLATLQRSWQAERQYAVLQFTATAEGQPLPKYVENVNPQKVRLGALGRGWFYRNLLVYCEFMSSLVDAMDPVAHRVFPRRQLDPVVWVNEKRFRKDLIMAQIMIPALTGQTARFARTQALIDEGVLVCALERYRLEQGNYPERLEDLVPAQLQILGHGLVTGGPLQYARKGGSFTLYQVGWDGQDHGGATGWTGEGKERKLDPAKGDWVWPHAHH